MNATTTVAQPQTETLEQIADRIAPNGGKAAAMKAAKAKAQAKAQAIMVEVEPTQEQQDALAEYIAAREAWEGLRDDIAFANTDREKDSFVRALSAATARYGDARRNAAARGVLAEGRRLFR